MSGIAKVKADGRFLITGPVGSAAIDYHEGELWRFRPSSSGANMLGIEFGEDIHLEVTVQRFADVSISSARRYYISRLNEGYSVNG